MMKEEEASLMIIQHAIEKLDVEKSSKSMRVPVQFVKSCRRMMMIMLD
ncbi:hypothetical protein [Candidatus Pantoea bituminis]|nr:hypothetical protein [Pantoea bituminis]